MPRGRPLFRGATVRQVWQIPLSAIRCTVVDLDTLQRCMSRGNHGWYHEFSTHVPQDLCLTQIIYGDTGKLRVCALPKGHDEGCIYLAQTERSVTLADVGLIEGSRVYVGRIHGPLRQGTNDREGTDVDRLASAKVDDLLGRGSSGSARDDRQVRQ